MKKLLLIGLIVCVLVSSYATIVVKTNPVMAKSKTEKVHVKKVGPDCKLQYDRKCNFGQPLVLFPGQITNQIDIDNFCRQTSISCPVTECSARLSVLFGFLPASPKTDSCLPAGYRGK